MAAVLLGYCGGIGTTGPDSQLDTRPIGGVLPPRYERCRPLARGGMGEVLLAEDGELRRTVAVKLLADRYLGDQQARERFKREALTAARLGGHPHIAMIHDVGEWNGRPYIVMEAHLEGSVADRIRSGPVDPGQALDWLDQVAGALDAAHRDGVVHRDIKPANMLVDQRGALQVADFGIARVAEAADDSLTAPGVVLGTPGYLSPEQARGEPATPASDRYSLAVVAYELLTGARPFDHGSVSEVLVDHIRSPVPPASERRAGLPREVDAVFERGLAKNPAQRHASAPELAADLRAALTAPAPARQAPTGGERRSEAHTSRSRRRHAANGVARTLLPVAQEVIAARRQRRERSEAEPPSRPTPAPRPQPERAPAARARPAPGRPSPTRRALSPLLLILLVGALTIGGGAVGFTYALSLLAGGLVVGALGRLLQPGTKPMGVATTIFIGALATLVVGLALHGYVGPGWSFAISVIVAVVFVRFWVRHRRPRRFSS